MKRKPPRYVWVVVDPAVNVRLVSSIRSDAERWCVQSMQPWSRGPWTVHRYRLDDYKPTKNKRKAKP
jgi:hypothetical protein